MTLGVGACLNHYEIIAPLGQGGVGEIWLSRDTRLNHTVALELQPD
jgi:serine/threonine protein kinase